MVRFKTRQCPTNICTDRDKIVHKPEYIFLIGSFTFDCLSNGSNAIENQFESKRCFENPTEAISFGDSFKIFMNGVLTFNRLRTDCKHSRC